MTDHKRREALRPHAQQLARLLASEEGACILGSLQQLRLLWNADDDNGTASADVAQTPVPRAQPSALRIGIWAGESPGGAFRRIPYVEAWNRYADVDVIPPKSERKRVLLLGESSARAYMYDPVITVARLLESYVQQHYEPVEVVDLAMIGQDITGLERILHASDALQPDALVVFAGNNWIFEPVPPLDEPHVERALARGDLAEAKRLHVDALVARVHAFLAVMQAALTRNAAHGLFVIPEFNLVHHIDQTIEFLPALPLDEMRAWIDLRSRAEAARRDKRPEECSRAAREMIALDRGLHPAGHRLLAECAERMGDTRTAYEHYCGARDVSAALLAYCTPRCPTSVQDAIAAGCRSREIGVLDLREVFNREHGLPDRELFLDYCHLTLRGLRLAVRAMAAHLLPAIGGPEVEPERIDTREPVVDARDEATAHLLAAIHNGHVGASLDAVTYGCETALSICPDVDALALSFLDFRSRRSPDWMPRSYDVAMQSRSMQRCLVTQPLPAYLALGDVPLYRAIEDVLEKRGVRVSERLERLRIEETTGDDGEIDLFRSRRITMTLLESRRYGYYRSRQPVSSFFLVVPGTSPVKVRVTWRTRNEGRTPVAVRLNGRAILDATVESQWTAAAFELPVDALRAGTNCLEIEWSVGAPQATSAGRSFYNPLRPPPEAYHVFGEIQDLTASR